MGKIVDDEIRRKRQEAAAKARATKDAIKRERAAKIMQDGLARLGVDTSLPEAQQLIATGAGEIFDEDAMRRAERKWEGSDEFRFRYRKDLAKADVTREEAETLRQGVITMSKPMVHASHMLTLDEKRLVYCAALKIEGGKNPDQPIKIDVGEFVARYGMTRQGAYLAMTKAASTMMNKKLQWRDKQDDGTWHTHWLESIKYADEGGYVMLHFSRVIAKNLSVHIKGYSRLLTADLDKLKSRHSQRFYELMMQRRDLGVLRIRVEDLIIAMSLPESYSRDFGNIKNRIIGPIIKELGPRFGLVLDEMIREGDGKRDKVRSLVFKFKPQPIKD